MPAHESSTAIQRIPFHDDELLALVDERTGKQYVIPKPMSDMFGLTWRNQLKKLRRNPMFAKGVISAMIPSAGGLQETVLLERRLVHAWLFSIETHRVAEEYRGKLLQYQEECADVLDRHFTEKADSNPRTQGDMLVEMAMAYREQEQRIKYLEAARVEQLEVLVATQAQALEALAKAQQAQDTSALALSEMHCMTIEAYVYKNGLIHQYPPPPAPDWKIMAKWLGDYCAYYTLQIRKVPVVGKRWPEENGYPLAAFAAWDRARQVMPYQPDLVDPDDVPPSDI